jgi:gliding motility-associated-like protein
MRVFAKHKKLCAFIFALIFHISVFSQCKISAPKNNTICLGDLGYFSISLPPGLTLLSADWKFGDGYTGTGQSPGHLYAKSGTFTVSCKLNLKGGTTCFDSVKVEVLNLPKANFLFRSIDTCFAKNQICVQDLCAPANSAQPILKRLIIWDDGSFDNIDSNSAKCHKYKQKTAYRITIEATDNRGCKNTKSTSINIVPSIESKFKDSLVYKCGITEACFRITTDTTGSVKSRFVWKFNKSKTVVAKFDDLQCFSYKSSTSMNVQLTVSNSNGCRDSFAYDFSVRVDTLPKQILQLSDTAICYSSSLIASLGNNQAKSYTWKVNGINLGFNAFTNTFSPRLNGFTMGRYKLQCTIEQGLCKQVIDTFFTIKGPIAKIKIYNNYQCGAVERVYFIDSSIISNPNKSSRFWVLDDPYGDSCISRRFEDINKYKNCNFSNDWYHKHDYKVSRSDYKVDFFVYDSISGCGDTIKSEIVNLDACGFNKKDTVCIGTIYKTNFGGKRKPTEFSLDSGITWKSFPSALNSPLNGWYSVLLKYSDAKTEKAKDYGDDSLKIYMDTAKLSYKFLKDHILVNDVPNAKFSFKLKSDCQNKDVVLKFLNTKMEAYEQIIIDWGDFDVDTFFNYQNTKSIDSFTHHYNVSRLSSGISVSRKNRLGCAGMYALPLGFGTDLFLDITGNPCLNANTCYKIYAYDNASRLKWDNTNKLGQIKLFTGESKIFNNDYAPCYKYTSIGTKFIKLVAIDKNGCIDSISKQVIQSDLQAGVTSDSKVFGCGEIKRLYDSSKLYSPASNDYIIEYLWDFGSKTYSTTEINPYHSFTKFGVYEVTHLVKSRNGCIDSVKFIVKINGPDPSFEIIGDTLGCEPLSVKFKNTSNKSAKYFWRFGDENQSSTVVDSTIEQNFTYTKPGKYFIKLTGIDTFYSNTTQSTYYCKSDFPADSQIRHVVVLHVLKTKIICDSNLCVGQTVSIQNLSDSRIPIYNWDFGDGTLKTSAFEPITGYTYFKAGTYLLRLTPKLNSGLNHPVCNDSVLRIINVKGILAAFEYEKLCESPLYKFTNTSTPFSPNTKYFWDFGQDGTPNNLSGLKDPMHDFGLNKGLYKSCLRLEDEFGCTDSICVSINNDYLTKQIFPNVFTPGFEDDKNDEYDIDIIGEDYYNLNIFNRWGQLVYQSKIDGERKDGSNWNGNYHNNGQPCPAGTYFYIFEYKLCYGDTSLKKVTGSITLIR